jgi:hypothetical protein
MFDQGAPWVATISYQPISNPEQQMAVTMNHNFEALVQERSQRLSYSDCLGVTNLDLRTTSEDYDDVRKRGWSLNNPNKQGYQDVPSAENFFRVVTKMYLASSKMKDKFMPTQARLDEYVAQLTDPDRAQHDAARRHYTRHTFEYFSQSTHHPETCKSVLGLYKTVSQRRQKACREAIRRGYPVPVTGPLDWMRYEQMSEYEKTFFTQVPMTAFEDSYNLLLDAHVGQEDKSHHGEGCNLLPGLCSLFFDYQRPRYSVHPSIRHSAQEGTQDRTREESKGSRIWI